MVWRHHDGIKSFTLVELLIVIAILAVLAAAVVIVLNPAELLAQARDSQRVTDLRSLSDSINIWVTDNPSSPMGSSQTVYISIPDTSSTCANISGLPSLPVGWTYHCSLTADLKKIDGSGWMPLNFNSIFGGSPISFLPIDPTNDTSSGRFYTYTSGGSYELTALMEAEKHDASISDGGIFPSLYQVGNHIDLTPISRDIGLIGYWKFDEGEGAVSSDSTGKWGNATLNGGVSWSSSCKRGYCLSFDGVDDYAVVSAKTALFSSVHGPATVMAWFYPLNVTGIHSVFGDTSPEFQMYTSNTSAYGKANSTVSMGTVAADGWYLGSVTHAHPTGLIGTIIKGYMNGDFVEQTSWTWTSQNGYANEGYRFGGVASENNAFQGYIDEIRIYNRALTAAEIKSIYDATK
ncbi:MAG: LamG domain-containing protein [Candidatus Colwellbacteria bacterium]|nr:LamG domain-containing protein [Candidatus Colwellbacteria bacterium]